MPGFVLFNTTNLRSILCDHVCPSCTWPAKGPLRALSWIRKSSGVSYLPSPLRVQREAVVVLTRPNEIERSRCITTPDRGTVDDRQRDEGIAHVFALILGSVIVRIVAVI